MIEQKNVPVTLEAGGPQVGTADVTPDPEGMLTAEITLEDETARKLFGRGITFGLSVAKPKGGDAQVGLTFDPPYLR